jgi:hypothetical protein
MQQVSKILEWKADKDELEKSLSAIKAANVESLSVLNKYAEREEVLKKFATLER